MMDPEETYTEETGAISKQAFDSGPSSPVIALGGWASGAGNALFAVTKGVSSRVEGVSFRMSARAKGMLSSIGDEDGGDGRTLKDAAGANGESHGPTVDEDEALKIASVLAENSQLAEKIVAMNKMSNVLGDGAGKGSQKILRSVAGPLVTVLRDAEHFDPFFANACIACAQQVSEAQGEAFTRELVEAGAAEALIPLLHPRFELVRIQGLALLGGLLAADRKEVCSRVVGVPTGMQALVDLLDDRWDEVRHEAVFLIAAFLAEDPDPNIPLPVDLQNFVAFQEGFEKLFRAAAEHLEQVSLRALEALRGALTHNPLSQKLFVSGGYLAHLPPLLAPIDPAEISDLLSIQASHHQQHHQQHQQQQKQQMASNGRRWGGWGGGKDKDKMVSSGNGGDGEIVAGGDGDEGVLAPPSPAYSPSKSPSSSQQATVREVARGAGGVTESGSHEREISVAMIRATLLLVSALVGVFDGDGDRGREADNIRGSVGREPGLMEAVCELALASSRAPVTGGPTWAEYGIPEDCQRLAADVLGSIISSHSDNQALFGHCSTRGAPIAVTLHGRKRLIVASEPRSAVDGLLELWFAASLDVDASEGGSGGRDGGDSGSSSTTAEVDSLDKLLDAFLLRNESWCLSALAAVSSVHHASALKLGDRAVSVHTRRRLRRDSHTVENGDDGNFDGYDNDGRGNNRRDHVSRESVSGAGVLSIILCRGLLASNSVSHETAKDNEESDDPTAAALSLRLFRRVLQAGGAGARALAAGIGIATEGAGRREEAARSRRESEVFSGQELYLDDSGAPIAQTREWGLEEPGGDGAAGAWWGVEGGGGRTGLGAGLPCGPPLTPALEVAVRLLADGYNVVVTMQRGVVDTGDDETPSPPSDLTRYLISLAELLVAWLSPPGAGPALSRRLLASGANWALLRTLGKALCPAASASSEGSAKKKAFSSTSVSDSSREVGESFARAIEGKISGYSTASLAYLHSVVTVIVGSFLSSAEALTRKTLSAGVAKHVGLFRFCRALDSATDWVSFAEMKEAGGERGRRKNVPSFWALSGDDAAFTGGMVAIIHSAQTSVIERIAGVPDLFLIHAKNRLNTPTSSVKRKEETANGDQGNGHRQEAAGYRRNGAAAFTFECDGSDEDGGYEELLRRQQLRIEELERRLLPSASLVGGRDSATKARRSPTLTI